MVLNYEHNPCVIYILRLFSGGVQFEPKASNQNKKNHPHTQKRKIVHGILRATTKLRMNISFQGNFKL